MVGQYWLRIGDAGEYESFGDDLDAMAGMVSEFLFSNDAEDQQPKWCPGRFEIGGFTGHDYISCFVGDADANLVRSLMKAEQLVFETALKREIAWRSTF